MTPEQADKTFLSVREAQQELLGASFGNKNMKRYEAEYGPYTGDYSGEIGAAELNLN